MNTKTNETYRYTVSITGEGGDFFFVPLTSEQVAFWEEKGNGALTEHLSGGRDEDGTPPEFVLGSFEDAKENASGIDVSSQDAELSILEENGEVIHEDVIEELDLGSLIESRRVIGGPATGAFIRTYERSEQTYELELTEPFDFDQLRVGATVTPKGILVNLIRYAEKDVLPVASEEKEVAEKTVELIG